MAKILVVDDEDSIRMRYAQELAEEGNEVSTSASAVEAVEKLEGQTYDLVMLDIKLKNESGLDLLQKIVKERHEMPVILYTAFSCYKDDFSTWLADGYIIKSSDLTELKEEIRGPGEEGQVKAEVKVKK